MSSLPNEMPALKALIEAEPHDPVAEDHRLLLAAMAVDGVDHLRDLALGHQLVAEFEEIPGSLRQQLADLHAARRRVEHLRHLLAIERRAS